jgi:WD40 repeat protein
MDFVKLRELPKVSATITEDVDTKRFKSYKKRAEENCGVGSDVTAMCFSSCSESSQLSVACGSKVLVYNIGAGEVKEYASWAKHKNIVHCISYRSDGKLLIAGDEDGSANIYDVVIDKTIIRRLRGHAGAIYACAFCPGTTYVATAGKDQTVKIWDVPTGQIVYSLSGHSDSIRSLLAISDEILVSAGSDGRVIFWDLRSGSQVATVLHGTTPVERLCGFPSGAMFYSIGGGQAKLWDTRSMSEVSSQTLRHTKPVTSAQVSQCGDFLITSSFDNSVKIVRISGWKLVASYTCPESVTAMAWKNNSICIGLANGTWLLRQTMKPMGTATEAPTIDQPRYYVTKELNTTNTKDNHVDFLFRKFEYRKLVDYIIESPGIASALALAILDELIQRGGLVPALRDRPVHELTIIVGVCAKFLTSDPRISMGILYHTLKTTIETNPKTFASVGDNDPESKSKLLNAIRVLNGKIGQELTLQYKTAHLAGLIETVISL